MVILDELQVALSMSPRLSRFHIHHHAGTAHAVDPHTYLATFGGHTAPFSA